jgi:uncharacterized protein YkwD
MDFGSFFSQFAPSNFGITILDVIIVCVVIFYIYEGYLLGFVYASLDLCSFILSFIIALKAYHVVAQLLIYYFALPIGLANAIGFFLVAFASEVILGILFRRGMRLLPPIKLPDALSGFFRKSDHWLGILPGFISAFIILSFLLSVIVVLPSSPFIKSMVTDSKLGSLLVANTSQFEKRLDDLFGGALEETLTFRTVKPQSNETVNLHAKVTNGSIDAEAEQEMFRLVNTERVKAGLEPVFFDDDLRDVARAHSQDMFARGYFSHYTPEGLSPFDRMERAGIDFTYAGENLALAPSTDLAMQGLMNSPGHRANILNPNFKKIGIGVIDGGMYGKMYSQEFSD